MRDRKVSDELRLPLGANFLSRKLRLFELKLFKDKFSALWLINDDHEARDEPMGEFGLD